jgi:hypothetical protein
MKQKEEKHCVKPINCPNVRYGRTAGKIFYLLYWDKCCYDYLIILIS